MSIKLNHEDLLIIKRALEETNNAGSPAYVAITNEIQGRANTRQHYFNDMVKFFGE